ncbi:hypothetical protein L4D76_19650 [Photobacterium sagamiensis]|uniref:hypothetical protein n=1 Tax=Photobacterium sagamiensis TaxID=2910241 RepID=UPI003D145E0F
MFISIDEGKFGIEATITDEFGEVVGSTSVLAEENFFDAAFRAIGHLKDVVDLSNVKAIGVNTHGDRANTHVTDVLDSDIARQLEIPCVPIVAI